jgi:hypothetical protein
MTAIIRTSALFGMLLTAGCSSLDGAQMANEFLNGLTATMGASQRFQPQQVLVQPVRLPPSTIRIPPKQPTQQPSGGVTGNCGFHDIAIDPATCQPIR